MFGINSVDSKKYSTMPAEKLRQLIVDRDKELIFLKKRCAELEQDMAQEVSVNESLEDRNIQLKMRLKEVLSTGKVIQHPAALKAQRDRITNLEDALRFALELIPHPGNSAFLDRLKLILHREPS